MAEVRRRIPGHRRIARAQLVVSLTGSNTTTELLSSVIGKGSIAEQQSALAAMGQVSGATGREAMTRLVEHLHRGR